MIQKDGQFMRTIVTPGKSFACGCDVVSTSGEVCRVHNQPIARARRYADAVSAQGGASNSLALANSLVRAIQEARDGGADWNCTGDSAVKLIAYQLMFLLKVTDLNDLSAFDKAMSECEARK